MDLYIPSSIWEEEKEEEYEALMKQFLPQIRMVNGCFRSSPGTLPERREEWVSVGRAQRFFHTINGEPAFTCEYCEARGHRLNECRGLRKAARDMAWARGRLNAINRVMRQQRRRDDERAARAAIRAVPVAPVAAPSRGGSRVYNRRPATIASWGLPEALNAPLSQLVERCITAGQSVRLIKDEVVALLGEELYGQIGRRLNKMINRAVRK